MVEQLSAILRVAAALDRRRIGAIDQVRCEYNADKSELRLCLYPSHANDDCAIELWNLDYKKDWFEAKFGVKLVATLES